MTTKKLKVGNVPNLRFPKFEGEWETKKLGEIATFSKGKGISKSDIEENGITECIRYGELYTHYGEVINEIRSRTNLHVSTLILSEKNDVIIPASGETAIDIATASCVIKSGVALSGDLNIIKSKINGIFLSYYLNSKKKLEIANLAQGISVVHLYSSQLASLSLNLPKYKEQYKIASFFSLLDERIATQNKIIKELGESKTTFAKRIFSGLLRFKNNNGNDYPEWEVKRLNQICYINPKTKSIPNTFYYIDLESVVDGRLLKEVQILKDSAPSRAQRVLEKNDVLFQMVRPYQKNNLLFDKEGDYVASTGYAQIRTEQNPQFIFQYLHNQTFVDKVIERCTGTSYPAISSNDLGSIEIDYPTLPEQTKIANFLSSVDSKIDVESQLLKRLEEQKKFLLQQMFV